MDFIKAFAAFLIVLYHLQMVDFGVVPADGIYYPTMIKVLWSISTAGVPLFFMVNGYLTIGKRYTVKRIAEKMLRLLFVGFFWGAFNSLLWNPLTKGAGPSFGWANAVPYWFLGTLAILYAINWVLDRLPGWVRIVIVLGLVICPFGTNFVWEWLIWRDPTITLPWWWHFGLFTMYSIVYQSLGYWLKRSQWNKYLSSLIALVGLVLIGFEIVVMTKYEGVVYEGVNGAFPTVGALLLTLGLFMILKDIKAPSNEYLSRYFTWLGNNALAIYLFHGFIIFPLRRLAFSQGIMFLHPVVALLVVFVTVNITASLSDLLHRNKYTSQLVKL